MIEVTLKPDVHAIFDKRTSSVQYVVACPGTRRCAIIDPVLDFDEKSGATATLNADQILHYVDAEKLDVEWILDTHPHADHFSAAHYLQTQTGAKTAIGSHVVDVQALWKKIYDWPDFAADGSQWNRLFKPGERFQVGEVEASVMYSPGHTLASVTYVIGNAAFIHDTMFMPDSGTARTDFPGGSAEQLWQSMNDIMALPEDTRLFVGHDYQPGGREPLWESSISKERSHNIHLSRYPTQPEFVEFRQARDRTLPMPRLILAALQININGGRLPSVQPNGGQFLKIPLNALGDARWD